jgi:hypothetical protein
MLDQKDLEVSNLITEWAMNLYENSNNSADEHEFCFQNPEITFQELVLFKKETNNKNANISNRELFEECKKDVVRLMHLKGKKKN